MMMTLYVVPSKTETSCQSFCRVFAYTTEAGTESPVESASIQLFDQGGS
jgi:hypothetical protein